MNIKVGLCELNEQSPFIEFANGPTLILTWKPSGNAILDKRFQVNIKVGSCERDKQSPLAFVALVALAGGEIDRDGALMNSGTIDHRGGPAGCGDMCVNKIQPQSHSRHRLISCSPRAREGRPAISRRGCVDEEDDAHSS